MCIRFVDDDGNIKEGFLEFGQWKWIDRKSTAEEILYTLQKVDLSVNNCWGQMYDGRANMSSEAAGIQSIIKNNSIKKSVYTDCCGHKLAHVFSILYFPSTSYGLQ